MSVCTKCDNCDREIKEGGFHVSILPMGLLEWGGPVCNYLDLCNNCKKWLDMAFEQMRKKVDIKK
jgi:hypothetical protein